jgi:hypothetical protein
MGASRKTHVDWALAFAEVLRKHFGGRLVSVVLYGSAATGRERPDSDVDLFIVLQGELQGAYRRRSLLDPVHEEWERLHPDSPFLSTLIKNPEEAARLTPIYFDMVDRRRLLVDRDGFMERVLEDVKKRLDRLGAKRRQIGKVEYWDLKPDYKPGEIFEI